MDTGRLNLRDCRMMEGWGGLRETLLSEYLRPAGGIRMSLVSGVAAAALLLLLLLLPYKEEETLLLLSLAFCSHHAHVLQHGPQSAKCGAEAPKLLAADASV